MNTLGEALFPHGHRNLMLFAIGRALRNYAPDWMERVHAANAFMPRPLPDAEIDAIIRRLNREESPAKGGVTARRVTPDDLGMRFGPTTAGDAWAALEDYLAHFVTAAEGAPLGCACGADLTRDGATLARRAFPTHNSPAFVNYFGVPEAERPAPQPDFAPQGVCASCFAPLRRDHTVYVGYTGITLPSLWMALAP